MTTDAWPTPEIANLAGWIRTRTGLDFSPARRTQAASTLEKSWRGSKAKSVAAYEAYLDKHPEALDELLADLTIGETYFFRQPAQFELIRTEILSSLAPSSQPFRLWSAGCATGEEAYSLAITAEQVGASALVLGSDLSNARLEVARRARYGAWSLRGVPDSTIERYFRPDDGSFQLLPLPHAKVTFQHLNLVEERYPDADSEVARMDVILCRNVLIYLDRESVGEVARKLIASLSDQGWLLLGASDPLISELVPVQVVVTSAGLVYRRPTEAGSRDRVRWRTPSSDRPVIATERPSIPSGRVEPSGPSESSAPPAAVTHEVPPIRDVPGSAASPDLELAEQIQRVRSLADRGLLEEAGRICAAALDQHRESPELLYLHALLLLSAGQPGLARDAARRALYIEPGLVVAHLLVSDALQRLGDPRGARASLRRAEKLLRECPIEAEVPAADGEPAGRLLRMVETRLALLAE
jgi:chemotaxis protein methyltransferase CheR